MGCGSSSNEKPAPPAAPPPPAAQGGGGGGKGGGKGKKGKGKGRPGKFQIKLEGKWQDYDDKEDGVLKRVFMVGRKKASFHLRGNDYEYDFESMQQVNKATQKRREIRPPRGVKPPPAPLLPQGDSVIVTVREGQAGTQIEIPNPHDKSKKIKVNVPAGARAGQKMAVPIPKKGETVEQVCERQQGMTTGATTAKGLAVVGLVGAGVVGGALLGDHMAGGTMAVDGADWVADAAGDAADWVGDWAPDAADAAGDWGMDAADDIADWGGDAADWLGDAAEDAGDWVMSLF